MQQKLWTKQYISALIVLFGTCIGAMIVIPVLPIFAKDITGLDIYAGLMITTFAIAALSVRFISGKIVETLGCKKVILGGVLLSFLAAILYINCEQIVLALIYRGMQGIGFGIAQTAISTYITKVCPPSHLMEGVNYAAIVTSLTSVLGPPIAFMLIGENFNQFNIVFIAAVIIALITFIIMLFTKDVELTKDNKDQTKQNDASEQSDEEVKDKPKLWIVLILPAIVLFLVCLSQSAITSFISLYTISLGFTNAGSFFSVNAIGMISSRLIISKLAKKYGVFSMIIMNCALFGISLFLVATINNESIMLLLALPAGFSMGAIAPIVNVYMIQKMPKNKNGIANALYYSSMDIGYAMGSFIWGVLASQIGYANIFITGASIQILCVIFGVIHMKKFKVK